MPEYLSPGVFIEEIPARLKAIEGVSTSTAGFVGESARGPVPGFTPFTSAFLPLTADPAPFLVTSFAEYQRTFGEPPANPAVDGWMGHSLRAFFDNGGRRAFIARCARPGATAAQLRLDHGSVLRLARSFRVSTVLPNDVIYLNSLRGIDDGDTLAINAVDGSAIATVTVAAINRLANSVRLTANLTVDLDADKVFIVPQGVTVTANAGPILWARSPGAWGNNLRVLVVNSDRPAVAVTNAIGATATDVIQVANTGSFYRGAIVTIDHGTASTAHNVVEVAEILPGNSLRLATPVSQVATSGFVQVLEIDMVVRDIATGQLETFKGLSWNPSADPDVRRRHYASILNTRSRLVWAQPPWAFTVPGTEGASLNDQPMSLNGFEEAMTAASGGDGTVPSTRDHIVGNDLGPGARSGIQSLQDVDDIRIIAAPGETTATVQNALLTQAERMRYRFAVLDGEEAPGSPVVNSVLAHRNAYDSSFGGYYTPWVQIGDADRPLFVPPSGYVTGIYARTDNERGVWKAPANEIVRGITGMRSYITTGEQDILNPRGVNAIRRFEGRGIRVWGARTLSSDPEFRYINVRRFLIFMEASIDRGTQWVVFEPNSPETWSRVVDSVSAFLHTQWRAGALFGRKPEDAFYVRCDETTMTVDDVQNGRLVCNIGVAIVRPAEFVIFRIEQITGFGNKS